MRRLKFYKLSVWKFGKKHYAAGYTAVQFVSRAEGARLYTGNQAKDVIRQFRRVKLKLALEEVPPRTQLHFSEMLRD